jgi:MarR family transcriptional regulator for hemolysin
MVTAPVLVGDSLSFLINKLAQLAGQGMTQALSPLEISPRESGILAAIAQLGSMTQRRIGEILIIDRTTMVLSIDHLEELGFVERVHHPTDRRAFLIELTPEGTAAMWKAKGLLETFEAELLAPLGKTDATRFRSLLHRIISGVLDPDARAVSAPRAGKRRRS